MKVFDIVFMVLIPLVLLFAGWMMQFHPPKKQNVWIGYRTTRSMKNAETWRFANTYCGKCWCISGGILLLIHVHENANDGFAWKYCFANGGFDLHDFSDGTGNSDTI